MKTTLRWLNILHYPKYICSGRSVFSRYHLIFILKFIFWFTIGSITGFLITDLYLSHKHGGSHQLLCDSKFPFFSSRRRQQQQLLHQSRDIVLLAIHVGETSQMTFTLSRKLSQETSNNTENAAITNRILHFVDTRLYSSREKLRNEQIIALKGLINVSASEGFERVLYYLLQNHLILSYDYCLVTGNVLLDDINLKRMLNFIEEFRTQDLLVMNDSKMESQQDKQKKRCCFLTPNCSLTEGLVLSRDMLERFRNMTTATKTKTCEHSKDNNCNSFESTRTEIRGYLENSSLVECISSSKMRNTAGVEYKCCWNRSLGKRQIQTGKMPDQRELKTNGDFNKMYINFREQQIFDLQERTSRLESDISTTEVMTGFIKHHRSVVDYHRNTYERRLPSQIRSLTFIDSDTAEGSHWHYTNDHYIYTTHNINKSPTQRLSVKNSSLILDNTLNALFRELNLLKPYINRPRFRYSYRHVCPVLGLRHFVNIETLRDGGKYQRNPTFFSVQKFQLPPEVHIEALNVRENDGSHDQQQKLITLIVPVAGRHEAFVQFLNTLKQVLKSEYDIDIVFIIFEHSSGSQKTSDIKLLQKELPNIKIQTIIQQTKFARAEALQSGVNYTRKGDVILLFMDIDMYFTNSFLKRVRHHTIRGRQAYFPIYFSQFRTANKCTIHANCTSTHFKLSDGFWRHFGFGMVSIYKNDFLKIGGYDLSIKGWGQEDIKLYESCMKIMTVFRAPDQGLVHIYHSKFCSPLLTPKQYSMCLGSKLDIYESQRTLADIIYNNEQIINRPIGRK